MSEETLKPCPFCGPRNVEPDLYENEYGHWTVGCGGCGSHCGTSKDKQRVVNLWNKRYNEAKAPPKCDLCDEPCNKPWCCMRNENG